MFQAIPFKTDDAILAFALENARVPQFRASTNTFDEAKLRKLGYRGLSLLEAAKAAWSRKDRGHVEYWFQKTPELPLLLKAYHDLCSRIDSDEQVGGVALAGEILRLAAGELNVGEERMDEREALLRLATLFLKGRVTFVNDFKQRAPYLLIPAAGEPVISGDVTTYPGFQWFPIDMAQNKLKLMNL